MMAKTRTVELIAKLRNNMTPGLRNIARGVGGVATAMLGMATAAFAAANKLSDYGANIYDISSATGVAVESVQSLGYAFEQTGGSMDSMSGAIRGLNTFMRTAATGSAEYMNVLSQLGLEYDSLRAMEPEQAFLAITDAIGGLDTAMERNIAATTVFGGRYAQQITGALDQAGGSLRTLTEDFEASGNAMSGEQIEALKKYSDAMTDIEFAMKKLTADALGPLLPKLQEMADKGMELAKDVLPQLIPLIETSIDVMAEGLPIVIDLLMQSAEGWQKLTDTIKNGLGTSDAENLMRSLEDAVKSGAITAEQATEEWEKFTNTGRSTIDTIGGMINPIHGMVNAVEDANNMFGIFGEQQITVNEQLNNSALLAFQLAEGFDAITEASRTSSTSVVAQANAMGMVALAYSNFINAPVEAETAPDTIMSNTATAAGKLELTLKQILENSKELVKPLLDAKTILEDDSKVRDEILDKTQQQFEYEQQMADARQASILRAKQGIADFATGMVMAAREGDDAWNQFWDNFQGRLLGIVVSSAFEAFLGVFSGGVGGFFGKIFGFKGGGPVPAYKAAGGMTVPGSSTSFGDKTPIMAEAGEMVLSRNQVNDMKGGSTVNHINLSFPSLISTASNAEIAQAIPIVKKIMQKGNL